MSSISGISSLLNLYPPNNSTSSGGIGQDLKSLESSLQSGNLSAAQTAFTSLQQDFQSIFQTSQSTTGSTGSTGSSTISSAASTIKQDLQAVSSALQSGDVNGAKTAFAKLKTDIQSAVKGHHGGHHHGGGGKSAVNSLLDTTDTTTTNGSSSTNPTTNLADTLLNSIQPVTGNTVNQLA